MWCPTCRNGYWCEGRPQYEWQPIETAPKDGTHILLFIESKIIEGWWEKREYDGPWPMVLELWKTIWLSEHGCGCCAEDNDDPTHWMPLPEGPDGI